jgi:chromosome segregation ATPase
VRRLAGQGPAGRTGCLVAALETELKTHAAREEELRVGVEKAETRAAELRQDMAAVEGRIAAAMDAASEASGALARARELIRVNQERAQELETLSQRDSRETESAKTCLAGHRDELDALKKDLIAATDAHETARQDLEKRQAALAAHDQETAAARKRLQELRTEALDLESRLARLQNEWNEIEARERTDLLRRERFAAEKAEAERAVESYAERLSLMGTQRDQKQAGAEEAQRQVADLRQSQAARAEQSRRCRRKFRSWRPRPRRAKRRSTCWPAAAPRRADFPPARRSCWKKRRCRASIPSRSWARWPRRCARTRTTSSRWKPRCGVVGRGGGAGRGRRAGDREELAGGPGRRGAVAVRRGRAGAETPAGAGEPLLDHVKAPAALAGLLRRLLGAVRVVATAADVPAAVPADLVYVTRDGIVARGDGSVEFWAPGENESNPLAREHQLAQWQEDLERLRREAGEAKARAAALQQDETAARGALEAAQTALENQRREMALAEGEIRMVEREAKQAAERAETIGWELEALTKKTGAGSQRRTEMAGEMETIRARQADVRAQTAADSEKLRQLEDERNALLEAATECRVALSGYKQQLDGLRPAANPWKRASANWKASSASARRASIPTASASRRCKKPLRRPKRRSPPRSRRRRRRPNWRRPARSARAATPNWAAATPNCTRSGRNSTPCARSATAWTSSWRASACTARTWSSA